MQRTINQRKIKTYGIFVRYKLQFLYQCQDRDHYLGLPFGLACIFSSFSEYHFHRTLNICHHLPILSIVLWKNVIQTCF